MGLRSSESRAARHRAAGDMSDNRPAALGRADRNVPLLPAPAAHRSPSLRPLCRRAGAALTCAHPIPAAPPTLARALSRGLQQRNSFFILIFRVTLSEAKGLS